MTQLGLHYVLSTHWDREWYQPFQDYRYRLVELLDKVIDAIEDGTLRGPFTCDGQAVVLEDYLEVRPERRAQVERLVAENKLIAGPWYVMPDLFLVSGESLIRNIQLGQRTARTLGGRSSTAAFGCDLFGHNSQMPQIYALLGLRGGFIWRGINQPSSRLIRWRGADGTELPTYRFGSLGYCSYAKDVRMMTSRDRHMASGEAQQRLQDYVEEEAEATPVDALLLFDGGDHQEFDPETYVAVAERIQAALPDETLTHSSLDDYLDAMLPQADLIGEIVTGELRESGRAPSDQDSHWLIPGVLSSRIDVLRANAACETALTRWSEPFASLAARCLGREMPQGFIDVAWRWLIKNHPHDSICGCSIDQVHRDMQFRFSQTRQIAERLTIEAHQAITANVAGEVADGELRVGVFNPMAQRFEGVAELDLQIPVDWPTFNEFFGFEPKPAFRVFDADGHELTYQRLGQAMDRSNTRIMRQQFSHTYKTNNVRVALRLAIPAMGYTTLTVRRGEAGLPTRYPTTPSLATSPSRLENEHLALSVESNGSLTLVDKRSGEVYAGLMTFEDCADIGDGWYHGVASNDQTFVSTACPAQVALIEDGPLQATLRVRTEIRVPAEFSFCTMTRAETWATVALDNRITLRADSDQIEVATTIHNTARDHRLRMLMPTGATADMFWTNTPFDMVERKIALSENNHLYRELEVEAKPQQGVTAIWDGQRGLALLSPGQYETAVRDQPARPVALTLMRSTRRTVMTDGEPDGQLLGEHTIRWALAPLCEQPMACHLIRRSDALAAGLRASQLQPQDVLNHGGVTELPPSNSLLSLEGNVVLTCAKQEGNELVVRFYNPESAPSTAKLTTRATQAQRVNLKGDALAEPMPVNGAVEMVVFPKEIVTLRLTTEEMADA